MTDTLLVQSVSGRGRLEIKATNRRSLHVSLSDDDLSGSSEVDQLGGGDGLHEYWADLARHWRGWSGTREWESLEGDLALSAGIDRTGHVALKVTLQHEAPWRWQVQIILAVEAGQLEGIAAAVLAFCRARGAAA